MPSELTVEQSVPIGHRRLALQGCALLGPLARPDADMGDERRQFCRLT